MIAPAGDLRPAASVAADTFAAARAVQADWAALPLSARLDVLRAARRGLADRADEFALAVPAERRSGLAETLTAEVLPLIDACRFLERRAARLLRPRQLGRRGRPFWLAGVRSEIRREPWGVVLVIGPSNYPLLLPGVQTVQALTAGNAVVLKPGAGGRGAALLLAELLRHSGLPAGLLTVLEESVEAGIEAVDAGPDKVLLTGSADTGRAVLRRLAETATPAVVELSGCDAAFVLDDADIDLVVRALAFGTRLNGGATCIAPRRVFVARALAGVLEQRLGAALAGLQAVPIDGRTRARLEAAVAQAIAAGARLVQGSVAGGVARPLLLADVSPEMLVARSDIFAPLLLLMPMDDEATALRDASRCPYALGASVFGGERRAYALAARIDAGTVAVNDLIVPTADARLPFGGWGASGYGVTRGAEGLLELTRQKCVCVRRGMTRHLDPTGPREERWIRTAIGLVHGSRAGRRALAREALGRLFSRSPRYVEAGRPARENKR